MGGVIKLKLRRDELLMLAIVYLYLLVCPYNKVEESFNTQAIHDMIYNTGYIYYYDHITFSGPVPRTFLGALSVALPTSLLSFLSQCSKAATYAIARAVLGLYVVWSFSTFRRAVKQLFGKPASTCLVALTCTQFHFLYYASRTLPNTFGMCCFLVATAFWVNREWDNFLWCAGAGVLIFRSELVLLLGPMLLLEIYWGRANLRELLYPGLKIGGILLVVCCSIDSYLWRYTVWPEAVVFYFNTWMNKSGDWGSFPLLWYFYSALPRAMLLGLPLSLIGCLFDRKALHFTAPALIFLTVYSLLPHKEMRFILYAVPLLNVSAAWTMSKLWSKGPLLKLSVLAGLSANLICCSLFLSASHSNYPGGHAMRALHSLAPCSQNTTVYIGDYAASTGVSRFGEQCDSLFERKWHYIKTEDLPIEKIRTFNVLVVEPREVRDYQLTHVVVERFHVYAGMKLGAEPPFLFAKRRETLVLMKSKKIRKKVEVKNH